MKRIEYRRQSVNVNQLIMSPKTEIVELLYANEFHYSNEAKVFKHYEIPVVTKELKVLSHFDDVVAAHKNQIVEMDVMMADGIDEGDVIRFAFKSIYFKRFDTEIKGKLIRVLASYLETNSHGQAWAKELETRGFSDINEKIGEILACHKETIKYNKRVNRSKDKLIPIVVGDLDISMSNGVFVFKYQDKECLLDKSEYSIIQKGKNILVKIPIAKLSIFQ